jgi:hypothetical protein
MKMIIVYCTTVFRKVRYRELYREFSASLDVL